MKAKSELGKPVVHRGTGYILVDEPCLGLYELNFKSPDQRSRKRYQIVQVMREDKPAEHRIDLGLANRKVDPFRIPGGVIGDDGRIYIEHTVGELQEIADQVRGNPPFDKRELAKV